MWTMQILWAGLAIGLAWIGVWIWEGFLAMKSIKNMWKNSELSSTFMVITVLWMALVESAAIYWLIIAMQIMNAWAIDNPYSLVAAWFAVWLAWLGAGVWEGLIAGWTLDTILRNPDMKWKAMTYMVLFIALDESVAIYWLIVALQLLN